MMYAIKQACDLKADLIFSIGSTTYLCFIRPDLADFTSETPVEDQACWKIQRIETEETEAGDSTTKTKYPNGDSTNYSYIANQYETYTYNYQH